jgi:hypothetical protein
VNKGCSYADPAGLGSTISPDKKPPTATASIQASVDHVPSTDFNEKATWNLAHAYNKSNSADHQPIYTNEFLVGTDKDVRYLSNTFSVFNVNANRKASTNINPKYIHWTSGSGSTTNFLPAGNWNHWSSTEITLALQHIKPSNCTFRFLLWHKRDIASYKGGDQGYLNEFLPAHNNVLFWSRTTKISNGGASGSRGIPKDKPFIFNLFLLQTELCNVSPEAIS